MKNILKYSIIIVIFVIIGFVLFNPDTSGFANYVADYQSPGQKGWWNKSNWKRFGYPYFSYWETFANPAKNAASVIEANKKEKVENALIEFPPDGPAQSDLSMRTPYHLLGDEFTPPREKETISCVNSRSCYAVSFDRMINKVGNYTQLTNNYKRGYPDSCSAPYQELVLNFYKASPMSP